MNNIRYITTTIPYVNAEPHVGFALELAQADVLARWRRSKGEDVRLQTGSDENSLKNVLAAEKAGVETRQFVSQNAARFEELQAHLGISADDFIRTSADPRHKPAVQALWAACHDNGDIYRKSYSGLYCAGCEQFYEEADLVDGCCPEHAVEPERVEETNWFFRLSRYADFLKDLIESGELAITPASKRNEVLSFINTGLQDFSISRSAERARGWGVAVPDDPSQTIYVWFDALANYISALGYGSTSDGLEKWWNNTTSREHVVGKGVTKFHAIYWPAILLSAKLPVPTRIHVHGYLTVDGRKIGKSNGNAVSPVPLIQEYGRDAVRYYLLRHIRSGEDGDFSVSRLEQAYNSELAGGIGNVVQRVLSIIVKNQLTVIPGVDADDQGQVQDHLKHIDEALEQGAIHIALAEVFDLIAYTNKVIADTKPWALVKQASADGNWSEATANLGRVVGLLDIIGQVIEPFLPDTATTLIGWIAALRAGKVPEIQPLFPRRG